MIARNLLAQIINGGAINFFSSCVGCSPRFIESGQCSLLKNEMQFFIWFGYYFEHCRNNNPYWSDLLEAIRKTKLCEFFDEIKRCIPYADELYDAYCVD